MVAMLTLFVCLLLLDFTRSDRGTSKRAVNATARSFAEDEASGRPGQGQEQGQRHGQGGEQGRDAGVDQAVNHRYPYPTPHPLPFPRPRDYGRSLKGHSEPDASQPAASATGDDATPEEGDASQAGDTAMDDEQGESDEVQVVDEDADDQQYDDYAFLAPQYRALSPEAARSNATAGVIGDLETSAAGEGPTTQEQDEEESIDNGSGRSNRDHRASGGGDDVPPLAEHGVEQSSRQGGAIPPADLPTASALQSAEDRSDDGHPEDAVALPFLGPLDRYWPPVEEDRDRDRWADLARMQHQHQLQQLQQQSAAVGRRRLHDAHRRNGYSELGTIMGEQYMLLNSPAPQNLGPVLFPSGKQQQQQQQQQQLQQEVAATHFVPKKLMKLMVSQQGGGSKPWSFLTSQPQNGQNQNQYLVVNNKGVVIPHSVNFPDIAKSANYPQLQSYRNQQSNKNVQDVVNYLKSKGYVVGGRRPLTWSGSAVKKAAKVTGVYATSPQTSDAFAFPRPEPYINEVSMAALAEDAAAAATSAESQERPGPDSRYNGHAYIADPFHPYKPSDPTEINQMMSSMDSETSASMSSERVRHSSYMDDVGEPFVAAPRPVALPPHLGVAGRYGRYRNPFLTPGGPQYTEATFKPLGGDTASDAVRGGLSAPSKSVPPLSVMLEIFPMGEAKSKEGAATVMWNNYPVAALQPVLRRPVGLAAAPVHQAEASVRRPVALPFDALGASTSVSTVPSTASRYPVLMQGQLSAGNGLPPFGVTLSGVQGLQALAGMNMLDSKHRMVVHLNFYPKKSVSLPLRYRDHVGDHSGQGASIIPGGTFSQRRQSHPDNGDAGTVGSLAVDLAPLLQSLPLDMRRHLFAIMQTYQRPPPAAAPAAPHHGHRDAREDSEDADDDISASNDSEEDYGDDSASVERPESKRQRPLTSRVAAVDAEPSYNSVSSSEEDVGDVLAAGASSSAQWLTDRERPWDHEASQGRAPHKRTSSGASSGTALVTTPIPAKDDRDTGSYFDVQDDQVEKDGGRLGEEVMPMDGVEDPSATKASKRFMEQVEGALAPRDRLALWRYWKHVQDLRRQDQLGGRNKRKKVLARTQRVDVAGLAALAALGDTAVREDEAGAPTGEQQLSSVPTNHRVQ